MHLVTATRGCGVRSIHYRAVHWIILIAEAVRVFVGMNASARNNGRLAEETCSDVCKIIASVHSAACWCWQLFLKIIVNIVALRVLCSAYCCCCNYNCHAILAQALAR
jgi:hypothetical protein